MITANGLIQLGFKPDIDFRVEDDGSGAVIKEWNSASPQPSDAEIEAADAEYQIAWNAQEYARKREPEYPSIADQLDYIYHNGIAKWKSDMVKPVKDAHPKP